MTRKRKLSEEELAEERSFEAHKLLAFMRYATGKPGFEPVPLEIDWTGDAWGGRVQMTATWYGWRRVGGGVVEIVLQPLTDEGLPSKAAPIVEVWGHMDLSTKLALFVCDEATYRAPWAPSLRSLLTDVVRARNAADERDS